MKTIVVIIICELSIHSICKLKGADIIHEINDLPHLCLFCLLRNTDNSVLSTN